MADAFDPYKALQVDREADPEVIQAAYRRLAQKYHPDVAPGAEAAERMISINRAWEVLRDPDRRRAYDLATAGATAGPTAGATAGARTSAAGSATEKASSPAGPPRAHAPEEVSRDWTAGRSPTGHSYDPSMRRPDGEGAAGPPPGSPSGSVLNFGRYAGWSLGELARSDLDYLEWLDRMPIGRAYRDEIDGLLRRAGRRRTAAAEAADRRGLFRRR